MTDQTSPSGIRKAEATALASRFGLESCGTRIFAVENEVPQFVFSIGPTSLGGLGGAEQDVWSATVPK